MTTLQQIISRMIIKATVHPGVKQQHRLTNNLIIEIKITNKLTYLQIHRSGPPSMTEWRTVLKSFPYPISITPFSKVWEGRHYLMANWPCQLELIPTSTVEKPEQLC